MDLLMEATHLHLASHALAVVAEEMVEMQQ
jgi:hypothetical protein